MSVPLVPSKVYDVVIADCSVRDGRDKFEGLEYEDACGDFLIFKLGPCKMSEYGLSEPKRMYIKAAHVVYVLESEAT